MKIISGKYQNLQIDLLNLKNTRPTKTQVREALFDIILYNKNLSDYSFQEKELSFLEVFSGYGIVSFEALSRGFKQATLIDIEPKLKNLFEKNAKKLKISEQVNFCLANANNLPKSYSKSDICFIDPPYYKDLEIPTLESLQKNNWLNPNALVIIETGLKTDLETIANIENLNFEFLFHKKYGKSKLSFLCFRE